MVSEQSKRLAFVAVNGYAGTTEYSSTTEPLDLIGDDVLSCEVLAIISSKGVSPRPMKSYTVKREPHTVIARKPYGHIT